MPPPQPQVDWSKAQPIGAPEVDWSKAQPVGAPDVDWSKAQPIEQQGGVLPPEKPSLIQRFDKTFVAPQPAPPNESVLHHVMRGASNFGGGVIGGLTAPILHPLDTLAGIGGLVTEPAEAIIHPGQDELSQMAHTFKQNPEEATESGLGNLVGGSVLGMGAAEAAPMAGKAVDALPIPTRAKAGALFNAAMEKAGPLPVELRSSSDPLMRAYDMGERGMTRPKVVNQLVRRVTAPDSEPLTYKEARDFAQSLSRQSSTEGQKLTPAMKAQIGKLSHAFNEDVGRTAEGAGVGEQYNKAMTGYRRAMQLRKALINTAKVGGGALATGYLAHRLVPAVLPER